MDKLTTQIEALKKSVGILSYQDLATASSVAINNLKKDLEDPNSAFGQDPNLKLEAVKVISKVTVDTIEAQRRVIDTLTRYNSLVEKPKTPADNLLPDEADLDGGQPVDESSVANSVFGN